MLMSTNGKIPCGHLRLLCHQNLRQDPKIREDRVWELNDITNLETKKTQLTFFAEVCQRVHKCIEINEGTEKCVRRR
jgi:methyltransferase-like protein